jgi:peptidoglycan/xylan/chitin deacetylase (PgdA/CDA1 family)
MGIFLIGYDVEAGTSGDHMIETRKESAQELTKHFMQRISEIHEKHGLPGTLFIVGKTVEQNVEYFKPYLDHRYLDFQQHTYNHTSLKPAVVTHDGKVDLFDFPTFKDAQEVRQDIRKTNRIFENLLGVKCRGLSTPFAYFMGLADRPDILKALHDEGLRYIRSFHLNKEVFEIREGLPFDWPPFNYSSQGFPDMIDFLIKGYSDVTWALRYGWEAAEGYVSYIKQALNMIEKSEAVFGLTVHDWSLFRIHRDFQVIDEILQYAKARDIEILSFDEAYEKLLDSPIIKDPSRAKIDWKVNIVRRL